MSRMKGVSLKCIQIEAARRGMTLWELYDDIIQGIAHTFDLTLGGPSFDMKPNFTVKSREQFKRRIGIKPNAPHRGA
jgi:hypothetical protein